MDRYRCTCPCHATPAPSLYPPPPPLSPSMVAVVVGILVVGYKPHIHDVTAANNYFFAFVHDLDTRTQGTTSLLQRCTRRPLPPRTSCLTPTPPSLWCRPPAPATSRPRPLPPPLPPTLGSQCPLVRASTFFAVSPIRRSQPKSASLGHPPHNAPPLVAELSVVSACDVGILICDHPLSLTICHCDGIFAEQALCGSTLMPMQHPPQTGKQPPSSTPRGSE